MSTRLDRALSLLATFLVGYGLCGWLGMAGVFMGVLVGSAVEVGREREAHTTGTRRYP